MESHYSGLYIGTFQKKSKTMKVCKIYAEQWSWVNFSFIIPVFREAEWVAIKASSSIDSVWINSPPISIVCLHASFLEPG